MKAPLAGAGRDSAVDRIRNNGVLVPASAVPFCEYADEARLVRNQSASLDSGTLIHPEPRRGVYRSTLDIIVPFVPELWRLLHLDRCKAVAQLNSCYRGQRLSITLDDLARHLAGDVTLAFAVLSYKRALFAVLDVDALFPELMPVIRAAALAIGGDDLLAAVFCTNGSDEGRGKVIVTFTEPVAASDARKLIRHLYRRVCASKPAHSLQGNELSVYPQEKSGGLVRILGRNTARRGPVEKTFSLDGEPGLSHIRSLTPWRLAKMVAAPREGVAAWAKLRIETPWMRSERTDRHYRWIVALAREAIRIFGQAHGRCVYDEWLDRIKLNSPELSLPSYKRNDRRNVLDHARERAWEYAVNAPQSWELLAVFMRRGMPCGVVRVYNALGSYVRAKGLRPESFKIDYERIARLVQSSKSTAYRWVERAVEHGLVIIHDHGSRHAKGVPGKCTTLGIAYRRV